MRILFLMLTFITSNLLFGESNSDIDSKELLTRFNQCDSTLSSNEILTLMVQKRDVKGMNRHKGLSSKCQSMLEDSLFFDLEVECKSILVDEPVNLTALYFYTISQLRQEKTDSIMCLWGKAEQVYNAIESSGDGSFNNPYFIMDVNDIDTYVSKFLEDSIVILSKSTGTDIYGNNCEVINIIYQDKKEKNLYFNFDMDCSIRNFSFNYKRDFEYYEQESINKNSKYFYDSLLFIFNSEKCNMSNNEVIALLIGFTNNKNYKPYRNADKESEIMSLIGDKEYKKSLKISQELLSTNPVNFTALIEEGFARMKLDNDKSQFPSKKSRKVVDAVLWSGNGSEDFPYFVLSPIDGQTVIKYIFGGSIGMMGSGHNSQGYFIDILEMTKEEIESVSLHFNIDHAMNNSEFHNQIEDAMKNTKEE